MHPITFCIKAKRRLRRIAETVAPRLMFMPIEGPAGADDRLRRWADAVPFAGRLSVCDQMSSEQRNAIVQRADATLNFQFDLLGSGPYRFANKIDWHLDFKSGYRWNPHLPHTQCRPRKGADIKVPWELSRFHHAVTLALAWQCTNDERYPMGLADQITHWIESNPFGFGVNWACSMDVAIRAVNWLVAAAVLVEAWKGDEFRHFRALLNAALWQHAHFIRTHLEWNGPKKIDGGNHFLADLTGLITLGRFFDDTTYGRKIWAFGRKELERQVVIQVLPDGVHFERSPSYHRLCLELFLWCGSLAGKANQGLSPVFWERIGKMQSFVADYMKSSGVAPLIGDNDNGRLLNTGLLPFGDHRYLLPRTEEGGVFYLDRFLLDGCISVAEIRGRAAAYPHGGFYILRNSRAEVIVRAGELGPAGGHAHNDQLSFELNLDGYDIFVDPGTYVYTPDPDKRNRYRSTSAHNTPQINNAEQNPFGPSVFGLPDFTRTRVLHWAEDSFEGEHYGFPNLGARELTVRRLIKLSSTELYIEDRVTNLPPRANLSWCFALAPGLTARSRGQHVDILNGGSRSCCFVVPSDAEILIVPFSYSPSYGMEVPSIAIVFRLVAAQTLWRGSTLVIFAEK